MAIRDISENARNIRNLTILYGNLLTKYGYFGGVLYLCIWFYLMFYLFKYHRKSDYAFLGAALTLNMFLLSFSGTTISDQGNFIFPYIIYLMVNKAVTEKKRHDQYIVANNEDNGDSIPDNR